MPKISLNYWISRVGIVGLGLALVLQSGSWGIVNAQTPARPQLTVTSSARILDVQKGEQAELTVTFINGELPMVGHTVLATNGSQLFPDNGAISDNQKLTDDKGQVSFIYIPDKIEDLVDLSFVGLLSDNPDKVAEVISAGNLDPADYVGTTIQLVKDLPEDYSNVGVERVKGALLAEIALETIASKRGQPISFEELDLDGNKIIDIFADKVNRLPEDAKLDILAGFSGTTIPELVSEFGLEAVTDKIFAGALTQDQIYALSDVAGLRIIEENQEIEGTQATDDSTGSGDSTTGTEGAGGAGSIAVLDTGVDPTFGLIGEASLVGWFDAVGGLKSPYDDGQEGALGQHGTKVSATVLQHAPAGTKIVGVKVLGRNGKGQMSDLIQGLNWVSTNAQEFSIEVINLSLINYGYDQQVAELIEQLIAEGIMIVAAAGNDGGDVNYPAAYPGVISVGAIDSTTGELAKFSSRGEDLDLATTGVNVSYTKNGQTYEIGSGTSFASPAIAGELLRTDCNTETACVTALKQGESQIADGGEKSEGGGDATGGDNSGKPVTGGDSTSVTFSEGKKDLESLGFPSFEILANISRGSGAQKFDGTLSLVAYLNAGAGARIKRERQTVRCTPTCEMKVEVNIDPQFPGTRDIVLTVQLMGDKTGKAGEQIIGSARKFIVSYTGPEAPPAPAIGGLFANPATIDSTNPKSVTISGTANSAIQEIRFELASTDEKTGSLASTAILPSPNGEFAVRYTPPKEGTRTITITAYGIGQDSNASKSIEIKQGGGEEPGEVDDPNASKQSGDIKMTITKTGDNANGEGFELSVETKFGGKLIDATVKGTISRNFGTVSSPTGSGGKYTIVYSPSEEAISRNKPALITFTATYLDDDGTTKKGKTDYSVGLENPDPGTSDVVRGLTLVATKTELKASPTNFGKARAHCFFGNPCNLYQDHINDLNSTYNQQDHYTVLNAVLKDGNGVPIANAPIRFVVSNINVGGQWSGYLASGQNKDGAFFTASTPMQVSTNSAGVAEAYYYTGKSANGPITITATNISLADASPAKVDLKVIPLGGGDNPIDGGGDGSTSDTGSNKEDDKGIIGVGSPASITFQPKLDGKTNKGIPTDTQSVKADITVNTQKSKNGTVKLSVSNSGDLSISGAREKTVTSAEAHSVTAWFAVGEEGKQGEIIFHVSGPEGSSAQSVTKACVGDCTADSKKEDEKDPNAPKDPNDPEDPTDPEHDPESIAGYRADTPNETKGAELPYQPGVVTLFTKNRNLYAPNEADGKIQVFIQVESGNLALTKGTEPGGKENLLSYLVEPNGSNQDVNYVVFPKTGKVLDGGTIRVTVYAHDNKGNQVSVDPAILTIGSGQSDRQERDSDKEALNQTVADKAFGFIDVSQGSGEGVRMISINYSPGDLTDVCEDPCELRKVSIAGQILEDKGGLELKYNKPSGQSGQDATHGDTVDFTTTNGVRNAVILATGFGNFNVLVRVTVVTLAGTNESSSEEVRAFPFSVVALENGGVGSGGSVGDGGSIFEFDPGKTLDPFNYPGEVDRLRRIFVNSDWLSASDVAQINSALDILKSNPEANRLPNYIISLSVAGGDPSSSKYKTILFERMAGDTTARELADAIADVRIATIRQKIRISNVSSEREKRNIDQLLTFFQRTRDPDALTKLYQINFAAQAYAQSVDSLYSSFGIEGFYGQSKRFLAVVETGQPTGLWGNLIAFFDTQSPDSIGGASASTNDSQAQSVSIWSIFVNWLKTIFNGGN